MTWRGLVLGFCVFVFVRGGEAQEQNRAALVATADSLSKLGQYADAELALIEALSLVQGHLGLPDSSIARGFDFLGKSYFRTAEYSGAERVWKHALDIRERVTGPNTMEAARLINNLAVLAKNQGRYTESEALFRKTLNIREQLLGVEHPDLGPALNNLANLLMMQAKYVEAEADYQRSLDLMQKSRGEDDSLVAINMNNLAALYHVQGRYTDAEPLYRRALEIMTNVYGSEHASVAQALNNLGYLYHDMGLYDKAEPLYQQALMIEEATQGLEHPKVAATLSNMARMYTDQGQYEIAEPLIRRSLAIGEKAQGSDHPEVAESLKILGDLLQLEGRYSEAEATYQRSLAILEKSVGKSHPVEARTLFGLAMLAKESGDYAKAKKYESRAFNIRRKNFSEAFAVLAERNALEASRFLQEEASNYVSILLDTPDGWKVNRSEIARVVLSIKGIVSDGIFARHKAISGIAALVDSMNQARQALSQLYVTGPDPSRSWAYNTDMQRLTQRKERFEADLARQSATIRDEKIMTDIDAARVAEKLPAGSALLDIIRYDHHITLRETESRYLAVVVKKGGKITVFPLGSAADIDSAVSRYRKYFLNSSQFEWVRNDYPEISSGVSQLVWQPLAPLMWDVKTIFLAPDGALSLVSFAGLLDEQGGFLIQNYAFHYLQSGRDLLQSRGSSLSGTGLLAIGDPDFEATPAARSEKDSKGLRAGIPSALPSLTLRNVTSGCRALRDMQVAPLPRTRDEIEKLTRRWTELRHEPVLTFFDSKASEENLRQNCHGKRVVHLATHGYYVAEECKPTHLGSEYVGESPLLQSGLFLAGSNLKGKGVSASDTDDGIVTAEEVAGLNLQGTQLVILSACETGVGEVHSGEGAFGLRRAFQMAGARTVISSLWSLDDESASEIIGQLFAGGTGSIAEAMRSSTLKRIEKLRSEGRSDNPFFWAALIATGDWNTR
jgi:CHAT domain-containing protein/Tfp pilus assembly protein PilF